MKPVLIEPYNNRNLLEMECNVDCSKIELINKSSKAKWVKPKLMKLSINATLSGESATTQDAMTRSGS